MNSEQNTIEWWREEYGFFGEYYLEGDNSKEGYLEKRKQTLEQRTVMEVEGVIKLLDLKPGQRILDLPCGYGRHAIGLAHKGIEVVGVDLNSVHLAKAIAKSENADLNIKFEQANMADIKYREEFDAAINMFYSFGFFESDAENFKVLQNFYNSLKPGGKFLFHTDVNIPRILQRKYKEIETRNLVSGGQLRIVDRYDSARKRILGSWIIADRDGKETKKDYSVRVYEHGEFIELCKQAGFVSFRSYSDWDGSPYSEDSEDMIIVAKK